MNDPQPTIQKLNKQYFDAINNPVQKIYVDLEMLQDLRLGALMTTITVKEEMEYIYSRLPIYNKKLNLRTAEYFPALKKTDEELDNIIQKDPFKVAFLSPWTMIYNNFNAIVSYLVINNKTATDATKPLEIIVNCVDIDYPIELFDRFVKTVTSLNRFVKIKISKRDRYNSVPDFYNGFNMFFLYDHETFLNNEKLLDCFTQKDKYCSKIIYTLPLINEDLKLDPSEYPKALASTSATLNLFCDFFYMQGGINISSKPKK